jgi:hypothetical protein
MKYSLKIAILSMSIIFMGLSEVLIAQDICQMQESEKQKNETINGQGTDYDLEADDKAEPAQDWLTREQLVRALTHLAGMLGLGRIGHSLDKYFEQKADLPAKLQTGDTIGKRASQQHQKRSRDTKILDEKMFIQKNEDLFDLYRSLGWFDGADSGEARWLLPLEVIAPELSLQAPAGQTTSAQLALPALDANSQAIFDSIQELSKAAEAARIDQDYYRYFFDERIKELDQLNLSAPQADGIKALFRKFPTVFKEKEKSNVNKRLKNILLKVFNAYGTEQRVDAAAIVLSEVKKMQETLSKLYPSVTTEIANNALAQALTSLLGQLVTHEQDALTDAAHQLIRQKEIETLPSFIENILHRLDVFEQQNPKVDARNKFYNDAAAKLEQLDRNVYFNATLFKSFENEQAVLREIVERAMVLIRDKKIIRNQVAKALGGRGDAQAVLNGEFLIGMIEDVTEPLDLTSSKNDPIVRSLKSEFNVILERQKSELNALIEKVVKVLDERKAGGFASMDTQDEPTLASTSGASTSKVKKRVSFADWPTELFSYSDLEVSPETVITDQADLLWAKLSKILLGAFQESRSLDKEYKKDFYEELGEKLEEAITSFKHGLQNEKLLTIPLNNAVYTVRNMVQAAIMMYDTFDLQVRNIMESLDDAGDISDRQKEALNDYWPNTYNDYLAENSKLEMTDEQVQILYDHAVKSLEKQVEHDYERLDEIGKNLLASKSTE